MKTKLNKTGFTLIEVLVVSGIFALIIGVSLTVLSTSRFSVNITESQIQATEQARLAITQITKELRLSRAASVMISDAIGSTTNNNTGSVINLQIPVGSYDENLELTGTDLLKWGSADTEDQYIAYSVDQDNRRLIRSVYSAADGSDATSKIIANYIESLSISRPSAASNLITIEVTSQTTSPSGTMQRTLSSTIKLRND